ncbi:MAG: four helix bundle protein [Elusimicrobiota bacterium]
MKSYRDLEVYKLAHKLAIDIHNISLKLPKSELYEEGSQIRRASKSVPANIVEGFCRKRYRPEYIRYLVFAHGSCNETIEHLEILFESGSLSDKKNYEYLKTDYEKLGGMLNRLIYAIAQDSRPEIHDS